MRKGLYRRRSVHTMSAFFCGLDVHKEYTYATLLGPNTEIITQKRMDNEEVNRSPSDVADQKEKVRRRAFLVRERAKLKTKIRSTLTYGGVKPPKRYGLSTRKGVEWLRGLGLEPVDCARGSWSPSNGRYSA